MSYSDGPYIYIIDSNRMHLSSDFKILDMGLHCHADKSIPLPILTRENYEEIIRKAYGTIAENIITRVREREDVIFSGGTK